MAKLDIVTN